MAASEKSANTETSYIPTEREKEACQRVLARRKTGTPAPRFKVTKIDGRLTIDPAHPNLACNVALLADMLGTGDTYFADGVLYQLANITANGQELSSIDLNTVVAFVRGIGPRDPTEALLATQMAAIHNATMIAARRLKGVETIDQQDSASNMLNKLARTFAAQIEALKRYRSSGEQSIRVQHVTVNEGGKAIVGNVKTGGGVGQKREHQPHELGSGTSPSKTDAGSAALLGKVEAFEATLPSPGGEGLECVPVPRGKRWSADRAA